MIFPSNNPYLSILAAPRNPSRTVTVMALNLSARRTSHLARGAPQKKSAPAGALPLVCAYGLQRRRRRVIAPRPTKPTSMVAHEAGSGTALTLTLSSEPP